MALAARPERAAELITLSEAARVAGVHRDTVRAWCARGDLPSLRQGTRRELRLRRGDLDRLLHGRARRAATNGGHGASGARRARSANGGNIVAKLRVVGSPRSDALRRLAPTLSGSDALRRLASELSGSGALQPVLEEVLDNSGRLFHADRSGLWLWHPTEEHPLELVASREFPQAIERRVRAETGNSALAGFEALRTERVIVFRDSTDAALTPEMRELYAANGISSLCFVPAVFRGAPVALLVLYHNEPYDWSPDEAALAGSFGDTIATAIGNTRLMASVEDLAARLRAIQDLSARLSGIQDVRGIGDAIVAEARALIAYDTLRVYRVEHETGWCEPIAFEGVFMGRTDPDPEQLRVRIGEGLTGWVAEHGETLLLGDAHADKRSLIVGETTGPESMLVVPMMYEDRVHGIVVVSRLGQNRFGPDDETTLSIFAGTAAQALVNAERLEQLRKQQEELEHQLVSQRRLMAVNERLLSTLDPTGVLEMIADSLKTVVTLRLPDDLPDRQGARRAPAGHRPRPVRRADPGLRRTAGHRAHGLGGRQSRVGAGERCPHGSTLDPDSGHAVRAGVDGDRAAHGRGRGPGHAQHRAHGWPRIALQPERVRAHQAVRRAGGDRAPQRGGARRGEGPGGARRADGTAQPRRLPARAPGVPWAARPAPCPS